MMINDIGTALKAFLVPYLKHVNLSREEMLFIPLLIQVRLCTSLYMSTSKSLESNDQIEYIQVSQKGAIKLLSNFDSEYIEATILDIWELNGK